MVNYIREKVSGQKLRYKDEKFNLDLTYITFRLIAMSYPADSFIDKVYRNNIDEVNLTR
jgi:phosphatidylinositol-3,4,5-trisphosphate 3-phosphatase/dual-specificity protein phosphatase PTEN